MAKSNNSTLYFKSRKRQFGGQFHSIDNCVKESKKEPLFGARKLCAKNTQTQFVIKIYESTGFKKQKAERDQRDQEPEEALPQEYHKFITAINTKKQIVIVMEYKTQQSLYQYLKQLHHSMLSVGLYYSSR